MFYSILNYHQFRTRTDIYVLDINKNNNGEDIHVIICAWTLKEFFPTCTLHFLSSRIDYTPY